MENNFGVIQILELLYYISSVVIAISAIIALKQLKIAKLASQTQAKRDALKLSASECTRYLETIIPLQNSLDRTIQIHGIQYFEGWKVNVEKGKINLERKGPVHLEKFGFLMVELLAVCNAMESFSVYFVSRVADEYTAFYAVGTTFVNYTEKLLPYIMSCNNGGHYRNIFKLYIIWKMRNEKLAMCKTRKLLDEKIERIADFKDVPIGVEDNG